LVILDECHNSQSKSRVFLNTKREYNLLKLTATVHNNDMDDVIYFYSALKAIYNNVL
jgi:superfamily II DNA or RNA helicase